MAKREKGGEMQVIIRCDCGNPLTWDEDLCAYCIDRLNQCEWRGLLILLRPDYAAIVRQVRSKYPEWDDMDGGFGL